MHQLPIHQRKRTRPTDETVAWREQRLANLAQLEPASAELLLSPFIEPGNGKTGVSGRFFRSIWVWNLPPMATCPGRSKWCVANCYNADPRDEVYPVAKWLQNLRLVEEQPENSAAHIIDFFASAPRRAGVRIHSSGDFYSSAYIDWWRQIIEASPEVRFWAYTRSWTTQSLKTDLERLRSLSNLQLFASWDATMPRPPDGWRLSIISEGQHINKRPNFDCPEQYEDGPSCADCGYCIRKRAGNVLFHSH